jgi:hypothetical protein
MPGMARLTLRSKGPTDFPEPQRESNVNDTCARAIRAFPSTHFVMTSV